MTAPHGADLDYCYLTTTGRTSGNPHTIEIWFALDDDRAYLLAGAGEAADWVRNIRANPTVGLRIGGREMICRARVVDDPVEDERARRLVGEKYAARSSGDLEDWRRTAVPVAVDLPGALEPVVNVDPVEANLYGWLESMLAVPGSESGEAPGDGRWIRTGLVSPIHNAIYGTRLEDDVDEAIDRALEPFRRTRTAAFWWTGSTSSAPEDLGRRLMEHGLVELGERWPGMAFDLTGPLDGIDPAGLAIEVVGDEASARRWAQTFADAYEVPAWAGESWFEAARRIGYDATPWRCYTAILDGDPVATAMLSPAAGTAGIQAVATAARARRRGVGSALMRRVLRDARDEGFTTAVLSATEDGEHLYRALGFGPTASIVSRYAFGLEYVL